MHDPLPIFYDRYIKLVNDVPLTKAFEKYQPSSVFDVGKLTQLENRVYAENKWTAKQILQHCIDTERVMVYRGMRFARYDETELPGFDENRFAKNAPVDHVSVAELLDELSLLRESSHLFFRRLNRSQSQFSGIASGIDISVEHLGYMLLGHAVHHQNIVREHYYPLLTDKD